MPAPDQFGEPTKRPLSTEEVGKWMRMLLAFDASQNVQPLLQMYHAVVPRQVGSRRCHEKGMCRT